MEISQSILACFAYFWVSFEGVNEGYKRPVQPVQTGLYGPVFLQSLIFKSEGPGLQSGFFAVQSGPGPVFFQS